jgi:hypothetical protein
MSLPCGRQPITAPSRLQRKPDNRPKTLNDKREAVAGSVRAHALDQAIAKGSHAGAGIVVWQATSGIDPVTT